MPRYFTPEEANAALAEVRPLVEQMVERRRELVAAQERQERVAARIGGNGGGIEPSELAELEEDVRVAAEGIAECISHIQRLGAHEIGYWHGLEDGFAGRRPLPLE